jgi:protein-L-isoaspartate O-methyltransferase
MQRRDPEGVETAAIAALVNLDGKRVIEVGCGGGRLTVFAAERAASVYAFDPGPENASKAGRRCLGSSASGCASRCTMHRRSMSSGAGSIWHCAAGRSDACRLRASCTLCAGSTPRLFLEGR